MKALDGEALGVGYNSAVVVDPTGEVVGNYRKTFRFETDKNWAREGRFKFSRLGLGVRTGYQVRVWWG
jgi:predicted amidohydrolase